VTMDKARMTTATFTGTTCTDPSASNNGGALPCVYQKTLTLSSSSCGASTLSGGGSYNVGSSASYSIANIPSNLTFVDWTNVADNSEVSRSTSDSVTLNADTGLVAHCDNSPTVPPTSNPEPKGCDVGTEADSGGVCRPTFNLNCQPNRTDLQITKGFGAISKPVKIDVGATNDQKLTFSAKLWASDSGYITDDAVKYVWNGVVASTITVPKTGISSVFAAPVLSVKVNRPLSSTPDYRLVVGATNEYGIYHECASPAVTLDKSVNGVNIREN